MRIILQQYNHTLPVIHYTLKNKLDIKEHTYVMRTLYPYQKPTAASLLLINYGIGKCELTPVLG
jgi:hypothetical protein